MLTIFSIPKAFVGHIGAIQRNAIKSWTLLKPRPEIILLGNEEGTAQVAQELGLRHIPEVVRNEHGTPLLSDLFQRAQLTSRSRVMCYVNADIILLIDFMNAVMRVRTKLERFLIVSTRINVDIATEISFEGLWEPSLKKQAREGGTRGDHTAIDVFVFAQGTYAEVPDFAIGRLWFDQWLIKAARRSKIAVVDVSPVEAVLHQNHDYSHVAGGEERVWRGAEAENNLRLYGGTPHAYTLLNATHELTGDGAIRRVRFRKPLFTLKQVTWNLFVRRSVGLRNSLRLRKKFWQPSKDVPNTR
jgi:hypothetical protein